jgi:hypothetical protein
MPPTRVSRRAALTAPLLALALAACAGPPVPTSFERLSWDYLSRLRLNVASIAIDDSWTPRAGTREIGHLAPTPPLDALRRMAEERLVAGGNSGRATYVIADASIVQTRDSYVGSFAVRLDVTTSDGARSGFAEARVSRTRGIRDGSASGTHAELYEMVRQMMTDMNVEFEYQIRRSLRDYLQTAAPEAPGAGPVDHEDLTIPGSTPARLDSTIPAPSGHPSSSEPASAVPFASPEPPRLEPPRPEP